jgi:uncharacterized protein YndB with AHSA1/START domain
MDNNALASVIDGDTLVFERTVAYPPERVWRAISEEAELTTWMRYPVKFKAEVGARVDFFSGEILGEVFIADPPYTLAFSFWDADKPDMVARIPVEWTVRWDLEPHGAGGTRIIFTHRRCQGHVLWGVGEGWHAFLDLLPAHLDGTLATMPAASWDDPGYKGRIAQYRVHVSRSLLAFAAEASEAARRAIDEGRKDDAVAAIERLDLATRQLYQIARQTGARPDFTPEE